MRTAIVAAFPYRVIPDWADGVTLDQLFGKASPPIHNFCFGTSFHFVQLKAAISPKVWRPCEHQRPKQGNFERISKMRPRDRYRHEMSGRAKDIIAETRKFGAVVEGLMFKTNEGSRQNEKFMWAGAVWLWIAKESRAFSYDVPTWSTPIWSVRRWEIARGNFPSVCEQSCCCVIEQVTRNGDVISLSMQ